MSWGEKTNDCLDAGGGWLSTWPCNGNANQRFTFASVGTAGHWGFQARSDNGLCIDAGTSSGLGSCDTSRTSQWFTTTSLGSTEHMHPYASSNLCWDAGHSHQWLLIQPCNINYINQQWYTSNR